MPVLEFTVTDIAELPQAADRILQFTAGRKLFAFYAPMGAGKTTLIKEICRHLGSHDHFSSPSYSIANEYVVPGLPEKIYHIDLYRIKDIDEALAAGIEEYIDGEHYCFIEWAELIEPLLPLNTVKVNIGIEESTRNFAIFMD